MPDSPAAPVDNSDTATVSAADVNTVAVGELYPSPLGRGSLRKGNPGNRGGTGRPPGVVKSWSRKVYEDVLRDLEERLADASVPLTIEQLTAIGSMAGRYGGLADTKHVEVTVASLHLDALRAPRQPVAVAQLSAGGGDTTTDVDAD